MYKRLYHSYNSTLKLRRYFQDLNINKSNQLKNLLLQIAFVVSQKLERCDV